MPKVSAAKKNTKKAEVQSAFIKSFANVTPKDTEVPKLSAVAPKKVPKAKRLTYTPPPSAEPETIPEEDEEEEASGSMETDEGEKMVNSRGVEIKMPTTYSIPSPTPSRSKRGPKEQQLSPAWMVAENVNIYLLRKEWANSMTGVTTRDYIQIEKQYVPTGKTKKQGFGMSIDIKYLRSLRGALDELIKYYDTEYVETDEESD